MTERQLLYLAYIRERIGATGLAPTYSDMQRDLGAASRGHAHSIVQSLVDAKLLVKTGRGSRNLRLPGIDLSAVSSHALLAELERRA